MAGEGIVGKGICKDEARSFHDGAVPYVSGRRVITGPGFMPDSMGHSDSLRANYSPFLHFSIHSIIVSFNEIDMYLNTNPFHLFNKCHL